MTATTDGSERQTIEELLARSAVYHALAMVCRYPDADVATWRSSREYRRLPELIERLGGEPRVLEAVRRLVSALETVELSKWVCAYEQIFGYAVQATAPLYELEYGEEHSHRQPQELGDIAAFYHAFGLQLATSSHERVDHLVTECEFLHCLLYKQACALDDDSAEHAQVCEEAARRFLGDHLGRWGPAFAIRLSRVVRDGPPTCLVAEGDRGGNGPLGAVRSRWGDGVLRAAADALLLWLLHECARLQVAAGSAELPLRVREEPASVSCASCVPTTCAVPPKAGQVAGTDEVT